MKNNKKSILMCVAAAALGVLICAVIGRNPVQKIHKLEQPLLLSGGEVGSSEVNILPKGTTLYYDQAFPEGFVRYKVYINVEGVKFDTVDVEEEFWIDPLTAFPVDRDQLRVLLRDYPITRSDLETILKRGHIPKSEIRELLAEY